MPTPPLTDRYQLPLERPVFGSRFGVVDHDHLSPHRGTDLIAAEGTPFESVANGKVVLCQWSDVLGMVTVTATRLRKLHEGSRTLFIGYCHQSARAVKLNQLVTRGQHLGNVGGAVVDGKHTSGTASSGSHLHMTFSYESATAVFAGKVFDPLPFINAHDHR